MGTDRKDAWPKNQPYTFAHAPHCAINFPFESKSKSRIAGPATVWSSAVELPLVVTTAYTVPNSCPGIWTLPFVTGAKTVSRPVKKATNKAPEGTGLKVRVDTAPGLGEESVREGKALTGRAGLVEGHETMKDTAREKTWLRPRGT
jgi:hypothetical protein